MASFADFGVQLQSAESVESKPMNRTEMKKLAKNSIRKNRSKNSNKLTRFVMLGATVIKLDAISSISSITSIWSL